MSWLQGGLGTWDPASVGVWGGVRKTLTGAALLSPWLRWGQLLVALLLKRLRPGIRHLAFLGLGLLLYRTFWSGGGETRPWLTRTALCGQGRGTEGQPVVGLV